MGVRYTTRERVMLAYSVVPDATQRAALDDALEFASRLVEGPTYCGREFYPTTRSRIFDHPNRTQRHPGWRLWVAPLDLLSVSTLDVDGTTITSANYYLEPAAHGPPYDRIDINLDGTQDFAHTASRQQAVTVTGDWGYTNDTVDATTLGGAIGDATTTTITVDDAHAVGVGDLIKVANERMIITDKGWADTTIDVPGAALTADTSDDTMALASVAGLSVGEMILINSERMLITDISGTTIVVDRAYAGGRLAAHASGDAINAERSLTVTRGATGSTATTHSLGDTVERFTPPQPVAELVKAEAINLLEQHHSGWARIVGEGDTAREARGTALERLRAMVRAQYSAVQFQHAAV